MDRTIEDIQKDIELLGIKGGYDIEQLLTPQDCRRLSYEIKRLNKLNQEIANELQGVQRWLNENHKYHGYSGYYPDLSIAISKLRKEVINNE